MNANELTRVDRCQCGKLEQDHFLDYPLDFAPWASPWGIDDLLYSRGLCEENNRAKKYTPMTPLELSVWIEEQREISRPEA